MHFRWQLPTLAATLMLATSIAADAQTAGSRTTASAQATDVSGQQQQSQRRRVMRQAAQQPQTKIACTLYGCHPIPPGCTPVTQYTGRGNPTGYDAVVCR